VADITRYRPEDRRAVDALYRRVFGHDAAEASRLRWEWQYTRNPNNPGREPEIWIAREGPAIVGQYATMPVQVCVKGETVPGSWGMDVMVAPERQRQGLGEVLFRTWDRNVGAALGLGLSESSHRLFQKLRWPEVGPLPCLVKPLTRRALRRPNWPQPLNRLVSALTLPFVKIVSRTRPLGAEVRLIHHFDESFTTLWDELAPKFDLAVRRDAAYLNWKFVGVPHVRYNIAALRRDDRNVGYAVYRHLQESRGRGTRRGGLDGDADDEGGLSTLWRWGGREARQADSDKIRTFAMHAGFRRVLRHAGYFQVKSTVEFVAKVNGTAIPESFYEDTDRWHVTIGDSDQDR
jgi:GNAT superfamily N-acetyltransferase